MGRKTAVEIVGESPPVHRESSFGAEGGSIDEKESPLFKEL